MFREWLAFDDFEHLPLHGTFLLDKKGRLRWQDIDSVPFDAFPWLAKEAARLLASD